MSEEMEFKQTNSQVARGSLPDALTWNKLYLIKNVSELRATYQIRLLLYRAMKEQKKLIIEIPKRCKVQADLKKLAKIYRKHIEFTRY